MNIKVRSVNGQVFSFSVSTWDVTEAGINLNVHTDEGRKIVWLNKAMVSLVEEE